MQRDLAALQSKTFDVVVVGGGIHGACVARDAALRGMSVALVEQGDFCSATSHNSLKTIHGGIRYLQHLNFKRAIESIREQQILRRTMGHLVAPLRFLMPTYGWAMRGPLAMLAGIALFEKLSLAVAIYDGNPIAAPKGRLYRPRKTLAKAPGLDRDGLTGGAIWADAQVAQADKAVIQILQDAVSAGAVVANYTRAGNVQLGADGAVAGIEAHDRLANQQITISAQQIVNATGPWASDWLREAAMGEPPMPVALVRSMNLVIDRPAPDTAVAVKSNLASDSKVDTAKRMFFMVPWQGKTVVGTTHFTHRGDTIAVTPDADEIAGFLTEFAAAYPTLNLTVDDVLYCYLGLTPGDDSTDADGAKLHESKIVTHAAKGLFSIISIKWTTARLVAERTVDTLLAARGETRRCKTRIAQLPDTATAPHLVDDPQVFAQTHMTHTQARHLDDVLLRRTNDVVLGLLPADKIAVIAETMATAFGWSADQKLTEVRRVLDRLAPSAYRQHLTTALTGENA